MWGTLPQQGAGMEAPSTAQSLAAALWVGEQGVAGWAAASAGASLPASQHLSVTSQQPGDTGGSPHAPAWGPGPGEHLHGPGEHLHGPHHSAASKIYVQGLPQALQHPVAVAGLFAPFGDVLDVKLYAAEVRLSGGSAVVRMRNTTQAAAAIAALNGVVPEGGWQQLTVRAAETAEQRSSRITAINGRQGGGGPGSPLAHALPPAGPGGSALRRVHSARSSGSHSALQCYTGALAADALAAALPMQRRSLDWPGGSTMSIDSRRSSIDVARCGSAGGPGLSHAGGRRSSSDSGSGSGSEEQGALGGGSATGSLPAEGAAMLSNGELQRMLLEAVLALVGQVEAGQLSLPAMRSALEAALVAAKQATGDDGAQALDRGRQLPSLNA